MKNQNTPLWSDYSPRRHFDSVSQDRLNEAIRAHVARFGNGAQTYTRRITACHEAGHCVAFQLSGLRPREARIRRDANTGHWHGWTIESGTFPAPIEPARDPFLAIALAFVWTAGACGETLLGNVADPGSSADEIVPAEFILHEVAANLGLPFPDLLATVRIYLWASLDKHHTAGEAIANALEKQRKLNRKELTRLLRDVPAMGYESIGREIATIASDPESVSLNGSEFDN